MAIKAVFMDDKGTAHLAIGLNRSNLETLTRGNVLVLPQGKLVPLTDKSDIVLVFEETDEALRERINV